MNGKIIAEMNRPKFVLDSSVIINHLNKNLDIDAFFSVMPTFERFISGITEIETLAKRGMSAGNENEAGILLTKFLKVDLLPAIKQETVALRRGTKLKLPDAIIAATAIVLDATCLSNDTGLLNLVWPNYRSREIPFTQPDTAPQPV
jgi:predicted nucleic acid-binding protein